MATPRSRGRESECATLPSFCVYRLNRYCRSPPADSEEESRLPKVSYDTLKDRQIKELLSQQDLPISGDRTHWIKQYQQCVFLFSAVFYYVNLLSFRWMIIWNANLDKAPRHRKTKPQLKAELAQWLETHQAKSKPIAVADAAAHEVCGSQV